MKKMLLILIIALFTLPVLGQHNLEGVSVNRGKIYMVDSDVINGEYIVFTKDSIEYYIENSSIRYVLGLNKVNKVMKYNGNYANTGGYIGGAVGCVGVLIIYAANYKPPEPGKGPSNNFNDWFPYVCFAMGVALIGYLVGLAFEDWKTVYSNNTEFLKNFDFIQTKRSEIVLNYKVYF